MFLFFKRLKQEVRSGLTAPIKQEVRCRSKTDLLSNQDASEQPCWWSWLADSRFQSLNGNICSNLRDRASLSARTTSPPLVWLFKPGVARHKRERVTSTPGVWATKSAVQTRCHLLDTLRPAVNLLIIISFGSQIIRKEKLLSAWCRSITTDRSLFPAKEKSYRFWLILIRADSDCKIKQLSDLASII